MKLYVTGSSSIKLPVTEAIPVEELELSANVWYVKAKAKKDNVPWAVLTSAYGLVMGGTNVAPYHGVIREGEVDDLGTRVSKQLREAKVDRVDFFAVPEEIASGGVQVNYKDTMIDAISKLQATGYNITLTESPLPTRNDMSKALKPQDIPKQFHQQKEAHMYLLKAQDEKGLWQLVRKSAFLPDLQIKARMLVAKFPNQKVEIVEEPKDVKLSF